MAGICFLDEETRDIFLNEENHKALFKYCKADRIEPGKIWFSNPRFWKDPFEKLFLDSKYTLDKQKIDYRLKNRVYCTCVTSTSKSEAAWNVYGSELQFRITKKTLLSVLEENLGNYDIYIGKVTYKWSSEILKDSPLKLLGLQKEDFYKDEAWVRLLFLKRQDYEYENEIRIVLVSKDEKESAAGINLEYQCDVKNLFPRVTLTPSPDISDEIRAEIITKLKKDFSYDDGEIIKNPLYESKEPRNINLDYRK